LKIGGINLLKGTLSEREMLKFAKELFGMEQRDGNSRNLSVS
jgi:hypothetical protein